MTEQQLGHWVRALRSGVFKQLQGSLFDLSEGGDGYWCCLGVYAQIFNVRHVVDDEHGVYRAGELGIPGEDVIPDRNVLIELNDGGEPDQYARVIQELESCPEVYITKGHEDGRTE